MDSSTHQAKYRNPTSETFDSFTVRQILLQAISDYCCKAVRFLLESISHFGEFKRSSARTVLSLLKGCSLFGLRLKKCNSLAIERKSREKIEGHQLKHERRNNTGSEQANYSQ
jgi:hypothetical protein